MTDYRKAYLFWQSLRKDVQRFRYYLDMERRWLEDQSENVEPSLDVLFKYQSLLQHMMSDVREVIRSIKKLRHGDLWPILSECEYRHILTMYANILETQYEYTKEIDAEIGARTKTAFRLENKGE